MQASVTGHYGQLAHCLRGGIRLQLVDLLPLLSQFCSEVASIVVKLLFLQQQLAVFFIAQLKRPLKGNCCIIFLRTGMKFFSLLHCQDVLYAHTGSIIDIC